jgi:GrpB-like predicted nucleotidyltransferase (UPF0157 family)
MENMQVQTQEFNTQFSPYFLVKYVTAADLFIQAEHENKWDEVAKSEIENLTKYFKKYDWFKCIEHIGSTSVSDITAKPVVDLMLGVKYISSEHNDIREMRNRIITKELRACGYKSEDGLYFWKLFGDICVNIHPVATSTLRWKSRVQFRDYLRENKEYVMEYEKLKKHLINQEITFDQYVDSKSRFIALVLLKNGWSPNDVVNGDVIKMENLTSFLESLETGGSHEKH